MNEEELKQEAEEYARKTRIKDENTYNNFENECISETQDYEGNYIYFPKRIIKAYIDGAKSRNKEIEELKNGTILKELTEKVKQQAAQIEKMKCCGNCKHIIDINTKFKYCRIQPDKIFNNNICDKWELEEK